jgi:hypothetical protein
MEPVEEEVEDVREAIFVRARADVSVVTVPAISELLHSVPGTGERFAGLGVPALRQFLR